MRFDKDGNCEHEDWRILIAKEKDGIITPPHNYRTEGFPEKSVKQILSKWCADCGALCIDGKWTPINRGKETVNPHKCPACDGTGLTNRPPWIAGDQEIWVDSSASPYPCKACNGTGIIWRS